MAISDEDWEASGLADFYKEMTEEDGKKRSPGTMEEVVEQLEAIRSYFESPTDSAMANDQAMAGEVDFNSLEDGKKSKAIVPKVQAGSANKEVDRIGSLDDFEIPESPWIEDMDGIIPEDAGEKAVKMLVDEKGNLFVGARSEPSPLGEFLSVRRWDVNNVSSGYEYDYSGGMGAYDFVISRDGTKFSIIKDEHLGTNLTVAAKGKKLVFERINPQARRFVISDQIGFLLSDTNGGSLIEIYQLDKDKKLRKIKNFTMRVDTLLENLIIAPDGNVYGWNKSGIYLLYARVLSGQDQKPSTEPSTALVKIAGSSLVRAQENISVPHDLFTQRKQGWLARILPEQVVDVQSDPLRVVDIFGAGDNDVIVSVRKNGDLFVGIKSQKSVYEISFDQLRLGGAFIDLKITPPVINLQPYSYVHEVFGTGLVQLAVYEPEKDVLGSGDLVDFQINEVEDGSAQLLLLTNNSVRRFVYKSSPGSFSEKQEISLPIRRFSVSDEVVEVAKQLFVQAFNMWAYHTAAEGDGGYMHTPGWDGRTKAGIDILRPLPGSVLEEFNLRFGLVFEDAHSNTGFSRAPDVRQRAMVLQRFLRAVLLGSDLDTLKKEYTVMMEGLGFDVESAHGFVVEQIKALPAPKGREADDAAMTTNKILLVDDDKALRVRRGRWLEEKGYEVILSWNPNQALGILRRRADISAVISDEMMPGYMRGTQMVQEIDRLFPGRDLPVIIVSSSVTSQAKREKFLSVSPRIKDAISKVLDKSDFLQTVDSNFGLSDDLSVEMDSEMQRENEVVELIKGFIREGKKDADVNAALHEVGHRDWYYEHIDQHYPQLFELLGFGAIVYDLGLALIESDSSLDELEEIAGEILSSPYLSPFLENPLDAYHQNKLRLTWLISKEARESFRQFVQNWENAGRDINRLVWQKRIRQPIGLFLSNSSTRKQVSAFIRNMTFGDEFDYPANPQSELLRLNPVMLDSGHYITFFWYYLPALFDAFRSKLNSYDEAGEATVFFYHHYYEIAYQIFRSYVPVDTFHLRWEDWLTGKQDIDSDIVNDIVEATLKMMAADSSMTTKTKETPGGIDLNRKYLKMRSEGEKVVLPVPVSERVQNGQPIEINGLVPVIINIRPATNWPLLLGEIQQEPKALSLSQLN